MRQHAWNKSEACYFNDLQSPKLSCHRGENSAQRDGLLALPGTVRKAEIQEVRAVASKSDKTNDFKIGWWIGVVTTTVAVISEKGGGCQLSMRSFMR